MIFEAGDTVQINRYEVNSYYRDFVGQVLPYVGVSHHCTPGIDYRMQLHAVRFPDQSIQGVFGKRLVPHN